MAIFFNVKRKFKTVVHQITFAAVGGIQTSFIPLLRLFKKKSNHKHYLYGTHDVDDFYHEVKKDYKNYGKSILNLIKFIFYVYSKNYIIHFYNNLSSKKIHFFLKVLPSSNLIYHERGSIWSAKKEDIKIINYNAKKFNTIIANSNATKLILNKRFGIDKRKIKVIHNGFISKKITIKNKGRYSKNFSIGFIGRLDTPKGVHILIEAAREIKNCDFFIAGDGILKKQLVESSKNLKNIFFLGRNDALEFISKIDVLVVPSIREPLGNVIIEAGFCNKAVIASEVDGIPELINHNVSGILIKPKNQLSIKNLPKNSVPIPDFVVVNKNLVKPREIDKNELIFYINKLKSNSKYRKKLGEQLNKKVKLDFTIEKYFNEIHRVYSSI